MTACLCTTLVKRTETAIVVVELSTLDLKRRRLKKRKVLVGLKCFVHVCVCVCVRKCSIPIKTGRDLHISHSTVHNIMMIFKESMCIWHRCRPKMDTCGL